MAVAALRQEATVSVAEIIDALEQARSLPEYALRYAVEHAEAIAPAVIDVVEQAAARVYLLPKQANLLFWGIHALAAARRTELYRPLLRLVRRLSQGELEHLLGDANTETLAGVLLSVFDGDDAPLIEMCLDTAVDGLARWQLLEVLARLTFDNRVPRQQTLELLDRFERENLAKPGDWAWQGWQQAIVFLGIEEMRERMHATWDDGRNPQRQADKLGYDQDLSKARAMAPSDPALFVQHGIVVIDDPVAALEWLRNRQGSIEESELPGTASPEDPNPADLIALRPDERDWLSGFFEHVGTARILELIDGFFCGLIAGPGSPQPGDYMSQAWGPKCPVRGPHFENAAQEEYVTRLLTRHWNTIAHRLARDCWHAPVMEDGSRLPEAAFWAVGFLHAITLRQDDWKSRCDDDFVIMLIKAMMGLVGRSDMFAGKGGAKLRVDFIAALPRLVQSTYNFWHRHGDPLMRRPLVPKDLPFKIGRNDPCPCGSGKKYKRCCGSPATSSG